MLERIYIDNYKCLVNFEYRPGKLQLLLGGNGSGKSTVFEVLWLLRRFLVDGETVDQLLPPGSRTRWQDRTAQTFELEGTEKGTRYLYKLVIEDHGMTMATPVVPWAWVSHEELSRDGDPVFFTQEVQTPGQPVGAAAVRAVGSGTPFLVSREQSALPLLSSRPEFAEAYDWISRLYCIQMNPYAMSAESKEEAPYPLRDFSNYASWYRHLVQQEPGVADALSEYMSPIILGFRQFSLAKRGETTRLLRVQMRGDSKRTPPYDFTELSEGQRALAGLYTLLALMKETPVTLCVDEPDNFVALPEIQPWLLELHDVVEEHGSQALIISHHPELINYLAPRDAVLFSRAPEGPVRVAPFAPESDEPLTAAEIVARGWEERAEGE
jgi:energy-coupling factor transporter ATP-binding protein EcfA2